MRSTPQKLPHWRLFGPFGILIALLITAAIYHPGLSGGYLFDDYPNIVENSAVHVTSLDWPDWRAAALASPSADLRRPLAMLSYAANYYFTGLDPRPMKLSNLLIHLLNGFLLWAVLLKLLRLGARYGALALNDAAIRWTALGLSAAWLLCPINLSSVLYVVQRMESLAQSFVLAGLLLYLHGRRNMLAGSGGGALCALGLALGTGIGMLCKETAVLLPLYAFLIELTLLRFAATSRSAGRQLWTIYAALLFAPGLVGLAWLLPRATSLGAYAGRPFTLVQRLLTELRVVVDYIGWTLLPRPGSLSFYHDDIAVSTSWLSPTATLLSGLLIAALLASAAALRRRVPLYALGIAWYFAAHLLTATFVPLELVFEHRNYFASIGLLLTAAGLILEIPSALGLVRRALPILAIGAFCAVTALRAQEWSDPIHFAYAEALQHPDSPRANYELGRTLTIASGYRANSALIDPAMQAFERAAALPIANAAPAAGLIVVANHMQRSVKPEWWQNLRDKLSRQPPSQEDIGALQSLANCQHRRECATETNQLLSAFLAALNHPAPSPRLLAAYGAFAANELGDYALATNVLNDAVTMSPDVAGYRIDLAGVFLLEGKHDEALAVLERIDPKKLDHAEIQQIDELRRRIQSGKGSAEKS